MRRALVALLAAAVPSVAQAEEESDQVWDPDDPLGHVIADRELGARLGLQVGQGTSGGGLRVGGIFLTRMTKATWSEVEASFVFGGGDPVCWLDRSVELDCAPGATTGAAAALAVGGRWFPTQTDSGFLPFFRGGLGVQYVDFRGDEVAGVAAPVYVAAGGRFGVSDDVSLSGELVVMAGPAWFSDDLGLRGFGGLIVQFGVDLGL